MSKVIECKGCIDCPFRYDDYDDNAIGNDTLLVCNLAYCLKLPLYLINSYDSWEIDNTNFKLKTPIWCPLKNEGGITVKFETK